MIFGTVPHCALVAVWFGAEQGLVGGFTPGIDSAFRPQRSVKRIARSANGFHRSGNQWFGGGSIAGSHFDADTLAVRGEHQLISVVPIGPCLATGSVKRSHSATPDTASTVKLTMARAMTARMRFKYSIKLGLPVVVGHVPSTDFPCNWTIAYESKKTHLESSQALPFDLWNPHLDDGPAPRPTRERKSRNHLTKRPPLRVGPRSDFLASAFWPGPHHRPYWARLVSFPLEKRSSKAIWAVTKPGELAGYLTRVVDYHDLSAHTACQVVLTYIFHVGHQGRKVTTWIRPDIVRLATPCGACRVVGSSDRV